jgi:hypothetical protein
LATADQILWAYFNDGECSATGRRGLHRCFAECGANQQIPQSLGVRCLGRSLRRPILWFAIVVRANPWRSLTESLSNTIALLDLHGAVVDRGEHLGRVARNHDVDDGWTIALLHTLLKGRS